MWDLSKDVKGAILDNKISAKPLSPEKSKEVLYAICNKYTQGQKYEFPLWEHLEDTQSIKDNEGWKKIAEFLNDSGAILFFEWSDDQSMFYFEKGYDIVKVIGNCHAFVFYITNLLGDYIICFNDHDYLIGGGTAGRWIKKARMKI